MTEYERIEYALDAVGDPIRLKILRAVVEEKTSPKQLAQHEGLSLGVVAYHFRTMDKAGLLTLASEKRVRGAVQHFYRVTPRGRAVWKRLFPPEPS